jgi:Phage integrase family
VPIDPANLRRAFRALIKAAKVPDKQPTEDCPKPGLWHPNEMRHSAGSYMDHMGVPPKRVASILGHEGTRTTETVYIHGQEVIDMTGDEFRSLNPSYVPAQGHMLHEKAKHWLRPAVAGSEQRWLAAFCPSDCPRNDHSNSTQTGSMVGRT